MSNCIKLYTLNVCSLLYVSYTLLNLLNQKQTKKQYVMKLEEDLGMMNCRNSNRINIPHGRLETFPRGNDTWHCPE